MLYAHIRGIVLYHDDTNDILQNTFIKAWEALAAYKGDALISTWLFRIATNEALQHLKRKKWRKILHFNAGQQLQTSSNQLQSNADEKLTNALKLLTVHQRTVFAMRYFNNIPYCEIAQILNIAEGTAKAVYHQSSKKIEKYIIENAE